ncbi:MAG: hypothetical protein K0Q91_1456 [Fibrobacteria bacterium]|jgi:hypothetical protein|nr:hypothetical protein [Fibrobacteria bacterium]
MRFIRTSAALFALAALLPRAVGALDTGLQLGGSSFKFLKLPLSPRATAMGGAGTGLVEGAGESELNPAAAALGPGALILGQEYPPQEFGTTASHLSWSLPWGERRITLNTRYLGFDKIPGWDGSGNATTSYDAYTLKLQAGLAGKALGFAYGVSAAYAQNNIAEATYSAGLVNAGLWRELRWGLSAGASVMNADFWTGSSKSNGEKPAAPAIFQAGLGYVRPLRPGMRVAAAVDARKVNDEEIVFPVGVEMMFLDALFARAGYPVGDPDNGFGLGIGLKWSRFSFHYAYKGHSQLSGGHGWTLEIRD